MRFLPVLFLLPLAAAAQSTDYTEPNGITQLAYVSGRAVVTETTPMPEFLDYTVELVGGRVLGQADTFGSLRFTQRSHAAALPTGYAPATGSIPVNQLAAAASQLQLALDELVSTSPARATSFVYRSDESFAVTGAYREGTWRLSISLDAYGVGSGTQMTTEQFAALIELLRSARAKA